MTSATDILSALPRIIKKKLFGKVEKNSRQVLLLTMLRTSYGRAPEQEIAGGCLLCARQRFGPWAFGSEWGFWDKQVNTSVSSIILGSDRVCEDRKIKQWGRDCLGGGRGLSQGRQRRLRGHLADACVTTRREAGSELPCAGETKRKDPQTTRSLACSGH